MKPTLLGLNRIAAVLGTGMQDFVWHGCIAGLLKEEDGGATVTILAIDSKHEGCGNCRKFLEDMLVQYQTVNVLDVTSPKVEHLLTSLGFQPFIYTDDGDMTHGFTNAPQRLRL